VKQKSHRGAAKRFRITRTGKVVHRGANLNHNLGKKSSSRKRRLGRGGVVGAEQRSIKRLLGGR
jgi:large subunit ribosomal protein L35